MVMHRLLLIGNGRTGLAVDEAPLTRCATGDTMAGP